MKTIEVRTKHRIVSFITYSAICYSKKDRLAGKIRKVYEYDSDPYGISVGPSYAFAEFELRFSNPGDKIKIEVLGICVLEFVYDPINGRNVRYFDLRNHIKF